VWLLAAYFGLLVIVNVVPSSPILVALMMEVIQEPNGVISQKTAFFIYLRLEILTPEVIIILTGLPLYQTELSLHTRRQ
jgi:hypothetical protein